MPRLKLTTLCLLAAACAVTLAAMPRDAKAQGICDKITVVPKKGCVTSKDVKDDSLTSLDIKNEAGADFAKGLFIFRDVPKKRKVYATVKLTAPTKGVAVVTANVEMDTRGPGQLGGRLRCGLTEGQGLGVEVGKKYDGNVDRGAKWAEYMLISTSRRVKQGTTRFNLVCQRIKAKNNSFSFSSIIVAEFYPL